MRAIDTIIVHCSDTPTGMFCNAETIRRWHVDERGWDDIGYHFVILPDGTVEDGRPLETPGAHVSGHNSRSIGLCLVGGKGGFNFTIAQIRAARVLIQGLQIRWPLATVQGHRDLDPGKECPQFDAPRLLT
jgi:N-acetylmuramoyl-L-alanine amidase